MAALIRVEVKCSGCDAAIAVLNVKNEKDRQHQLHKIGWQSKPPVCPDCRIKLRV